MDPFACHSNEFVLGEQNKLTPETGGVKYDAERVLLLLMPAAVESITSIGMKGKKEVEEA